MSLLLFVLFSSSQVFTTPIITQSTWLRPIYRPSLCPAAKRSKVSYVFFFFLTDPYGDKAENANGGREQGAGFRGSKAWRYGEKLKS